MIFAPHLAGCSCAGFYMPLDPAAVEEDLADFLANRYEKEGRKQLAEFVSHRARNRTGNFGQWLESLDDAYLDQVDRQRLMKDLRTTLDSMNGTRAARSGFVCY
jgi:NAD kinase